jgi:regulation of enolase protein 1 (concanavalin A-like superfamily)
MQCSRRNFVQQSLGVAGALIAGERTIRAMPSAAFSPASGELFARMIWMNPPESVKQEGDKLIVQSRAKTDFWRKTSYGYITDNGHFFHLLVEGDFTFQACIGGKYAALYDQAGLMVRFGAENWMKCGTEFFDGRRHASVVFTRDFSDWSTMPDLSDTAPVWWRAVRRKYSMQISCSADGQKFTTVREGFFPPREQVQVGIMCAAPEGPGFEATFSDLKLQHG